MPGGNAVKAGGGVLRKIGGKAWERVKKLFPGNNRGSMRIGGKIINATKRSLTKERKLLKQVNSLEDKKIKSGKEPWWSKVFRLWKGEELPETRIKVPGRK